MLLPIRPSSLPDFVGIPLQSIGVRIRDGQTKDREYPYTPAIGRPGAKLLPGEHAQSCSQYGSRAHPQSCRKRISLGLPGKHP